MSKNYAQIANDIVTRIGVFRQGAPDTVKAFGSLSTAATATKALDTKTKELIAVVSNAAFTVNRDTDQADRCRAAVGAFHAQVRPH
jgi:alkylhydroperoxidase/carboxymuconolactone decarboxylase family protein YurZ